MKKYFTFDKTLFGIMATLLVLGLFVFLSASFSAFGNISKFKGILFNQLVLGLGGGAILFLVALRTPYELLNWICAWWCEALVIARTLVISASGIYEICSDGIPCCMAFDNKTKCKKSSTRIASVRDYNRHYWSITPHAT